MKAVVRAIDFPARGRLLAVSDVHGNLPWLKGLLERAAFSPGQSRSRKPFARSAAAWSMVVRSSTIKL